MKHLINDKITYVLVGTLTASTAGITMIQEFEGKRNHAYLDVGGVPTICYGSTANVKMGDYLTDEQCTALLIDDISKEGKALNRNVKVPISQAQYDALLSFTYNVGAGNFGSSTLVKKLNQGDYCGAANQFPRWVYVKDKKTNGLVKRRATEREVFISGTIGGCDE